MSPAGKAHRARHWTLALLGLLLLAITADHTLLRPTFRAAIWFVQAGPLLLVIPGLLRADPRSGVWLCFMILLHFLLAVDNAVVSGQPLAYAGMAILVTALFIASLLFTRWQARAINSSRPDNTETPA